MARIELLDLQDFEDERIWELAGRMHQNDGKPRDEWNLANHFRIELHSPEVMLGIQEAYSALRKSMIISEELFTKLRVAISMANECPYCTGVFCTIYSTDFADDDAAAAHQLQEEILNEGLDDREQAVVEFVITATRNSPDVTDEQIAELREEHGLSDTDLVELVFLVNIISGYNRLVNVFDADFEPRFHTEDWEVMEAADD